MKTRFESKGMAKPTLRRWGTAKAWLARFVAGQIVPVKDEPSRDRLRAAANRLSMRVSAHPEGLIVVWDGKRLYDRKSPPLPPPSDAPLPQCPSCQAEFLPVRAGQVTCGKPRCTRIKCASNPLMCECGRGLKVKQNRGCAQCEAESERFYESESAWRRRTAAAEEKEWRERVGMVRFAEEWNKTHRGLPGEF